MEDVLGRLGMTLPDTVMADGEPLDENLRRGATSHAELHEAVRLQGLGSVHDVRAAVLERNGHISVVPTGTSVDLGAFGDVVGAHAVAGT